MPVAFSRRLFPLPPARGLRLAIVLLIFALALPGWAEEGKAGEEGVLQSETFQFNYVGFKDAAERLQPVLSERGSMKFDERANIIFMTDAPDRLAEARQRIAEFDVPLKQVLFEARVLATSWPLFRDIGKKMGGESVLTEETGENFSNTSDQGAASLRSLNPMLFSREETRALYMAVKEQEDDGKAQIVFSPRFMTSDKGEAQFPMHLCRVWVTPQVNGAHHLRLGVKIRDENKIKDWDKTGGIREFFEEITEEIEVRVENGGTVMVDACVDSETKQDSVVLITPRIIDPSMINNESSPFLAP
jgi:type II secretory pathway component GspD/PulD (secretin)